MIGGGAEKRQSLLTLNNVPRPMVPPNSGIMATAELGTMFVNVTPLSVPFYVSLRTAKTFDDFLLFQRRRHR